MQCIIVDAPGKMRLGNMPDPTPGPDELVIRVGACGICGTDLHIAGGDSPLPCYPLVPGHEFAGEVVALGSKTRQSSIVIGSRVAIEPNMPCGQCDYCRTGHENLCRDYAAVGVTANGAMAEYVAVPAAKAYVLPDTLSLREAALIEPLSCAVHGMHRLAPMSGDTFLIVGAGTMGLLLLQLALRGGAARVVMVDVNAQRLTRAESLGATRTYTTVQQALEDEPLGFSCVVDATGVAPVIEQAFTAVKRCGKLLIFGVAGEAARVSLSPFRIYNDEITVLGAMAILFSFGPALDLMRGGIINTQAMLTTAFPLEDFERAFDQVRRGEGVKTQFLPNT